MTTTKLKAGDLVRVRRHGSHGVLFGAVCEIKTLDYWGEGRNTSPCVTGPIGEGWTQKGQLVDIRDLKLAKQAMRKRDQYQNRRG